MTSVELENLVRSGQLKREPPSTAEIAALRHSGEARLADAARTDLSFEGRFDLAYNAAHALSLAALRQAGYRGESRYIVFQTLPHTLAVPNSVWRILAKCHGMRNQAEYEGVLEGDARLIDDLVAAATTVLNALKSRSGHGLTGS